MKAKRIALLIIAIMLIFAAVYILQGQETAPADVPSSTTETADTLYVMAIDVGQGDSILITTESGEAMLIDAGQPRDAASVKEELDERGIERIDVLIGTHPHADHIGGMAEIVESYDVGRVYLPDMTSDSQTYGRLIDAINKQDVPVNEAYAGLTFEFGAADCTIVSPEDDVDKDPNNESVVLLLDYLDTEFLFTGDMESWAEQQVLESGYNVDADVLKVAHHGSSTGTSEEFLRAVSPDYAVISCGADNKYGHPHSETLSLLDSFGIDPLRTDLLGDVLFISDGQNISVVTGD